MPLLCSAGFFLQGCAATLREVFFCLSHLVGAAGFFFKMSCAGDVEQNPGVSLFFFFSVLFNEVHLTALGLIAG